ncbi:S-adenosylmethionine-dependent methyltransferase [Allocatelliglobosispora scoriae]|uniref:S-adenosylmethionine-dependent methyltransferase n=1 Tax=Allocatelliglobosispora scoriae TaxID=643052 RepID=A0A841C027_9ACTN|nr:methyltransferase domain-containing protein [Allocatelliglobosispora scoriae]MBB5872699.1 S-adenosylmethionine-dependent methyltransferase [Allocatelliglobosispora scoriae]
MPEPSETFDAGMSRWQDLRNAPWGRLRYGQAEANLARHLGEAPLRVLDLGGGDGADAIRLARSGHRVSIVDYSAEMLAGAEQEFAAAGLSDRLTVQQADVDGFTSAETFDLVLCHNLIQYSPDPAATLATAAAALRPGGLLSVIAINKHAIPLRKATMELDPAAGLAAVDAEQARAGTFETNLRPYTAGQVLEWLAPLGHRAEGHYGIRAVSDLINDNERKHDPAFFADLERLELRLADLMPYPLIARFFHLVSRALDNRR